MNTLKPEENSNFYSHASCEARPAIDEIAAKDYEISTHTPLARRDDTSDGLFYYIINFYSHASCEARHYTYGYAISIKLFLLTRLLRGATCSDRAAFISSMISTHTPLARRD